MSGDLYKSWALESSSEDPIQLREFEVSIFRANRFLSIRLESEAVSRLTSLATSYLAIITGANWFITQHWGFFLHQVFYRGIYVGFLAGTEVLLLPGLYTTVLKGFENWSSQGLEFYPTLSAVWWRETSSKDSLINVSIRGHQILCIFFNVHANGFLIWISN